MDATGKLNLVVLITTSCLTGIALIFLSARVALQVLKQTGIWWDGHTLIASWILLLVGGILTNLAIDSDFGGIDTRSDQVPEGLYGGLARLFVVSSTVLSKTAYGLTILRLMDLDNNESRSRKFWWIIVLILVSVNLTTWPAALFPLLKCIIGFSSAPEPCWTSGIDVVVGVAGSGCSGGADVVLALVPLAIIYEHNVRHLSRPLIIFAMVTGAIAAVAAFTQCSQISNNHTTTLSSVGFGFVISSFAESTLTIAMAASLPIRSQTAPHVSSRLSISRISDAQSRASTAFWHDRGRVEDMEALNNTYYRPQPSVANAMAVSSMSTADGHSKAFSGDFSPVLRGQVAELSPSGAPRDSKASLFERTWSTISSALHDLEPLWAQRRSEAAARHRHVRPYTPSFHSSQTIEDDCPSILTMRLDGNHIISRLSDIVEESWRDRSILKTPEPAALIYITERERPSYRAVQSDWDIENGSMI